MKKLHIFIFLLGCTNYLAGSYYDKENPGGYGSQSKCLNGFSRRQREGKRRFPEQVKENLYLCGKKTWERSRSKKKKKEHK